MIFTFINAILFLQVPLSKFLMSYKGRVQDRGQHLVPRHNVRTFSITLMDGHPGPFQLDIDYIGLVYDAYHNNIFHYEMYAGDPFLS